MAEESERSSRTEQPTSRKLDQARRDGDVVKSADVPTLLAFAGAAGVVALAGGWIARNMAGALIPFLAHPEAINLSGGGAVGVMHAALIAGLPALMVLAVAALGGVAGNLIQHGFLWAPSKLAPSFSKIDPLQGVKRLFSLENLINFLKSLAKLGAVSAIAWFVLKPRAEALENMPALDPVAILPYSSEVLRALIGAVLIFTAALAGLDWFLARQRYMARMRMTREEVKQDHRDTEGDPHVKGRQKQIRMTRSRQRMIQNVPKATVVVVNPTHYAVALRYDQGETAAPVCVAKGVDRVALKIREVATAAGVPVIEDPPLARALYATIDVDEAIPREHYQAVAQIIGFVMGARPKTPASRPRASAPPLRP
jgi:flagellar biosynthetic protein FlhB